MCILTIVVAVVGWVKPFFRSYRLSKIFFQERMRTLLILGSRNAGAIFFILHPSIWFRFVGAVAKVARRI